MRGPVITITSVGDEPGGAKVLFIIAAVLLGIGLPLLVLVPAVGAKVTGGLLSAFGLGIGFGWWKKKRVTDRLAPGVIEVDRDQFTLGSRVPARFRRLVKEGSTDTQSITARLVQTEWVRYRAGTDTRTVTEEIQSYDLPVTRAFDGQHVLADLELAFPAYPPSFEASDNKVLWRLHVDVTFLDGFSEDSIIPLWVLPAAQRSDVGGRP